MDSGFVFMSSQQAADDVAYAETKGFSHAWLYDSQMLCADVYTILGLAAVKTSRIKLGPGVTHPSSRIAPLTACSIATINQLAPGRAILGIGTGNTARRTLGMPAAKLEEVRDHVETCRGLLHGKTVPYVEGDRHRNIRFLNPDFGYINIKDEIPIYIAAGGPKIAQLAGEVGDGMILFGAVHSGLIKYLIDNMRIGAERAGRDPDRVHVLSMTAFYLSDAPLNSDEVKNAVGPMVVSSSNIMALSVRDDPTVLPEALRAKIMEFTNAYREAAEPIESRHLKLYSGYLQKLKAEHAAMVTPEMIRATTLAGSKDQVLESLHGMFAAGVHQIAIQPILDTRTTIDQFATDIMPHLPK